MNEENRSEADVRRWRSARDQLKAAIVSKAAEQKQAKQRRWRTRELEGEARVIAHAQAQEEVARLRAAIRLRLLAYAYLRGIAYRRLERRVETPAYAPWIANVLVDLGWETTRELVQAWLDA